MKVMMNEFCVVEINKVKRHDMSIHNPSQQQNPKERKIPFKQCVFHVLMSFYRSKRPYICQWLYYTFLLKRARYLKKSVRVGMRNTFEFFFFAFLNQCLM